MARVRMLDGNMRIMRNEKSRVEHECAQFLVRIKDNQDKVEKNRVLPYLVANIVEVIDMKPEEEIDPDAVDNKEELASKCAIVKTTTRQVDFIFFWFLPPSEKIPKILPKVARDFRARIFGGRITCGIWFKFQQFFEEFPAGNLAELTE